MNKIIHTIFGTCYKLLKELHFNTNFAKVISLFLNLVILWFLSVYIYRFFKFVLVKLLEIIAKRTETKFDDLLVTNKTAQYLAYLMPFLFIYISVPIIMEHFDYWEKIFGNLVAIYIVLLIIWITRSVLNATKQYLKLQPRYNDKPIDSYIQVFMIFVYIFGFLAILLYIFNTSFQTLITTFGAVSALFFLIFRDTILGFVASIQVTINDLVRIGDWITIDKFGADGDVIEINLSTVKVRNFDNTTTTIPTYSLISDSFRNWRGMLDSPGRRIKRHILIRPKSIRFLETNDIQKLKKIHLITNYLNKKEIELDTYNNENLIDKSLKLNGRNLTNFGLFRKYINEYLTQHEALNQDMTIICRQLQPTHYGLPLEIYCFTKNQKFENYEYIMADIFDHILASIIYFDLEIYESVTSN